MYTVLLKGYIRACLLSSCQVNVHLFTAPGPAEAHLEALRTQIVLGILAKGLFNPTNVELILNS